MGSLYDVIEKFFDVIFYHLVMPVIHGIEIFLYWFFFPVSSFSPRFQILIIALVGAAISKFLSSKFSSTREERRQKLFKARLEPLKHTHALDDKKLEKIIRKGVHQAADDVYEKIIIDKFFEMGVTYFLPLFFFLIWIEYVRFTPARLSAQTGIAYAWMTASGANISAAYLYIFYFNTILLFIWLIELLVKKVRKRKHTQV